MATRRNDHHYVQRAKHMLAKAKANDAPCHLCAKPIHWDADPQHPLAPTADHEHAVAAGGSMLGKLLPAHRRCNSSRGKKSIEEYLNTKPEIVTPTLTW